MNDFFNLPIPNPYFNFGLYIVHIQLTGDKSAKSIAKFKQLYEELKDYVRGNKS